MIRDASLSPCGTYRYSLTREWSLSRPMALFIMLNPSTADASLDDPTIRRCIDFAKRWDAGGLYVVNLFALRATDPKVLYTHRDPIGPVNDNHLLLALQRAGGPVVCAWGAQPIARPRGRYVIEVVRNVGRTPQALSVTKGGDPGHPLYLPKSSVLTSYP